jgi:hypothetical protein
VRLILARFRARRWHDRGGGVVLLVEYLSNGTGIFTPESLSAIPRAFFEANAVEVHEVSLEIRAALEGFQIGGSQAELIPIDKIDSFSRAFEIAPSEVAGISSPLQVPEKKVKQLIAQIIGEPYVKADWGGEADDLFSDRVVLNGQRVPTSFILKGPGTKGPLTLSKLGANGDQLDRMLNQPARLFVVQHANEVAVTVRNHLRRGILALRASGAEEATGSVWDGSDVARLLVAHGMVDLQTGRLNPGY